MSESEATVILNFEPELKNTLPETYRLLKAAKIIIHPSVQKITLHGSRGPAGGYRIDSDIDLCLITLIDDMEPPEKEDTNHLLKEVLQTTLESSQCPVELDLAAVFDRMNCGLNCFNIGNYGNLICEQESTDCLGIYKIQKGFNGIVPPIMDISKIYPYLTIWTR